MLTAKKKANIIKKAQLHKTDTGSSSAQIALLSKRIEELTKHLKKHKGDNHSRRGLMGVVADRRKHLRYLEKNNQRQYNKIVKTLGLKK